jgi:hypothetical protein
MFANN